MTGRAKARPAQDDEATCAGCRWRGGYDEGAGRLGQGLDQYCHHPERLTPEGRPASYARFWDDACSQRAPFPPGQRAEAADWPYPEAGA